MALPDVDVDHQAVIDAATALNTNKAKILQDLQGLHQAVGNLLTADGGLWLKKASPMMSMSFSHFYPQLSDTILSIEHFADHFKATADNLTAIDEGYAKKPEEKS